MLIFVDNVKKMNILELIIKIDVSKQVVSKFTLHRYKKIYFLKR